MITITNSATVRTLTTWAGLSVRMRNKFSSGKKHPDVPSYVEYRKVIYDVYEARPVHELTDSDRELFNELNSRGWNGFLPVDEYSGILFKHWLSADGDCVYIGTYTIVNDPNVVAATNFRS